MAEYTLSRIPYGWMIQSGIVSLEAVSPHIDRGQIRAVLTVRQDDLILYRNTTNLTSERSRSKVVTSLSDKGVTLSDSVLVALDDACRQPPEPEPEKVCDGGTNLSEQVPHTLQELEAVYQKHLLIIDRALLVVTAGVYLAHQLKGEPVWLLIVAPPGGTKTEVLRSFYGAPGVYALSKLTPRTFASGLDTPGKDPSLLARLHDEILVVKDLTTVLQMQGYDRSEIFAQLREIYDGQFDMAWGTGKELHWTGRIGFIAGVTPIIDNHHEALSVLGERFVMLRTAMPDRKKLARRALDSSGNEDAIRRELADAMRGFLAARGTDPPLVSDSVLDTLATVADFVTRARSGVIRNGYRRELEYAPEPEAPTRFAKVLRGLACGIALAHDRNEVTLADLGYVLRVALDSLPDVRRRVITVLAEETITSEENGELATSKIVGMTQFSTSTIRRTLEDLQALRVVAVEKHGQGRADTWRLHDEWRAVFVQLGTAALKTVSEKWEPPSQPFLAASDSTHENTCDTPSNFSEQVQGSASEKLYPPSQHFSETPVSLEADGFSTIETDLRAWLQDGTLAGNRRDVTRDGYRPIPAAKLETFVPIWLADLDNGGAPEREARMWLAAAHRRSCVPE